MALYEVLVESEFNFIKGKKSIDDIYSKVKGTFPMLCDDNLMCSENCRGGHNQPEWKHRVRNALSNLKKNNRIKKGERGYWIF